MKLNLQSPVPLYHQLQEILRQRIGAKAWAVGGQIPSEHELCAAYGVTRPTVRQALEGLVREGLLVKRRGKGAFVTEPPVPVGMFSVAGTSEAFEAHSIHVETACCTPCHDHPPVPAGRWRGSRRRLGQARTRP